MDELEQEIVDLIEEHGWYSMSVVPDAESDDPEQWTYTIGLPKTFGWPELICFGLDSKVTYDLLRGAIEECQAKNLSPEHGLELTDVIDGFPARLIEAGPIPKFYFGYASWYGQQIGTPSPPKLLQLLWPDKQGRFPNEPDCAPDVIQIQTPAETE